MTGRQSRDREFRRPTPLRRKTRTNVLRIFVELPILSSVIAALILLAGLASIPTLPIAEYPQITPPTVTVTSTYIGADAATVEAAVTNPLEEQINGVKGLRYM